MVSMPLAYSSTQFFWSIDRQKLKHHQLHSSTQHLIILTRDTKNTTAAMFWKQWISGVHSMRWPVYQVIESTCPDLIIFLHLLSLSTNYSSLHFYYFPSYYSYVFPLYTPVSIFWFPFIPLSAPLVETTISTETSPQLIYHVLTGLVPMEISVVSLNSPNPFYSLFLAAMSQAPRFVYQFFFGATPPIQLITQQSPLHIETRFMVKT